ncbi:MAG TPA: hypothetical protein VFL91_33065 [Thermomicrobiales bacterium]|nr:hypothetical protein [Thermomicrobiales bacterium]
MAEEEVEAQATPAGTTATRMRTIAIVLMVAGVALILVSVFARRLGLGPSPGFGWKKLSGTVLGVALVVAGVLLWRGLVGAAGDAGADAPTEPDTRGIE